MRRVRTTRRDILEKAPAAPDLVKRNFAPGVPDRLRVADITCAGSWEGWLYPAFVLDACSRKMVGWSMANHLRTELVLDALNMAIHNRRPAAGLVHHSDRGGQYTSVEFGGRLKEAGLVPSMGPVADAYDNAPAESFVSTLERELLHRHSWPSRESVRVGIFEYIECFYNLLQPEEAFLSGADESRRVRAGWNGRCCCGVAKNRPPKRGNPREAVYISKGMNKGREREM